MSILAVTLVLATICFTVWPSMVHLSAFANFAENSRRAPSSLSVVQEAAHDAFVRLSPYGPGVGSLAYVPPDLRLQLDSDPLGADSLRRIATQPKPNNADWAYSDVDIDPLYGEVLVQAAKYDAELRRLLSQFVSVTALEMAAESKLAGLLRQEARRTLGLLGTSSPPGTLESALSSYISVRYIAAPDSLYSMDPKPSEWMAISQEGDDVSLGDMWWSVRKVGDNGSVEEIALKGELYVQKPLIVSIKREGWFSFDALRAARQRLPRNAFYDRYFGANGKLNHVPAAVIVLPMQRMLLRKVKGQPPSLENFFASGDGFSIGSEPAGLSAPFHNPKKGQDPGKQDDVWILTPDENLPFKALAVVYRPSDR